MVMPVTSAYKTLARARTLLTLRSLLSTASGFSVTTRAAYCPPAGTPSGTLMV